MQEGVEMTVELYLIILIAVLIVLNLVAPAAVRTYLRYHGKRVINYPETRTPAAVNVDTVKRWNVTK
jgi:hypothetical protein